jgi:hypothetical protein
MGKGVLGTGYGSSYLIFVAHHPLQRELQLREVVANMRRCHHLHPRPKH